MVNPKRTSRKKEHCLRHKDKRKTLSLPIVENANPPLYAKCLSP